MEDFKVGDIVEHHLGTAILRRFSKFNPLSVQIEFQNHTGTAHTGGSEEYCNDESGNYLGPYRTINSRSYFTNIPSLKHIPKKENKNPFKVGDEVQFISLDPNIAPKEIWSTCGGSFNLTSDFSLGKTYTVKSSINNEVRLKGFSYGIPYLFFKKVEKKSEEFHLKPGWCEFEEGRGLKNGKIKYAKITSIETFPDYCKVYYNAISEDGLVFDRIVDYWASDSINKHAKMCSPDIASILDRNCRDNLVKISTEAFHMSGSDIHPLSAQHWKDSPAIYVDPYKEKGTTLLEKHEQPLAIIKSSQKSNKNKLIIL